MAASDQIGVFQKVRIKGFVTKITQHQRRDGGGVLFVTQITVPAPDTLSHPSTYGVNGDYPAGALDAQADVVCDVASYQRRTEKGTFFNCSLWLAGGDKTDRDI